MSYDPEIEKLTVRFLEKAQLLISLLNEEGDSFRQNNLVQIERLAPKKSEVQTAMASLLDSLQTRPSLSGYEGAIQQKLSAYAMQLPESSQRRMQGQLTDMKASVEKCEQLMAINKQVIRHNQNYLQNLVTTLVHHQVKTDAVTYGKTGELQQL